MLFVKNLQDGFLMDFSAFQDIIGLKVRVKVHRNPILYLIQILFPLLKPTQSPSVGHSSLAREDVG
jgi:hypothetical protein